MKIFLRLLLYCSLVFLLIYLYSQELLVIPELRDPVWFFLALFFVLAGYTIEAYGWKAVVRTKILQVSFRQALISSGKFVFSKYIPGKVWTIAGRAGYIKERYNDSFTDLASLSLYYQLIAILAGAFVGFGVLVAIDTRWFWFVLLFIIVLILLLYFGYKPALAKTSKLISYIFKKDIELTYVAPRISAKLLAISMINWLVWSIAFYLFLISVHSADSIPVQAGLLFPISTVLGVLAIFAPAGLGIREGFLALGLTALGLPAKEAASVAILSRLWFLIGEALFFILAIALQFFDKKMNAQSQT